MCTHFIVFRIYMHTYTLQYAFIAYHYFLYLFVEMLLEDDVVTDIYITACIESKYMSFFAFISITLIERMRIEGEGRGERVREGGREEERGGWKRVEGGGWKEGRETIVEHCVPIIKSV